MKATVKKMNDSIMNTAKELAKHFMIEGDVTDVCQCTAGHINRSFFVKTIDSNGVKHKYTMQRINKTIFKRPDQVMSNIVHVTEFLRKKIAEEGGDPTRETLTMLQNRIDGKHYYIDNDGEYWRMYIYIRDTVSYDIIENSEQFKSSGYAFGKFQRQLSDFPADTLYETIPNFHNTVSRYSDFLQAVKEDKMGRAASVQEEIKFITDRANKYSFIVDGIKDGSLPLRVTHNDTKLNNVMMDEKTGKAICVIDLDTIMPGSALYDFGDSIRFGASSALEDEKDLSKVYVRLDMFEEYLKGFIEGLGKDALTHKELVSLPIGAYMMTIETGMRFLGDYLNGDVYFAVHREGHNLDRARTQLKLVADMESKMDEMNAIVAKYI